MFCINRITFVILIEVFDLFETEFICSSTIFVYFNDLVGWKGVVAISIFKIVLIYYNDKWRYRPTIRIDALNHSDPFPIAKLYNFNFLTPVVWHYNKDRCNLIYKKAYFIEVLNVRFYNIIFDNYILEKLKPNFNYLWVFILGFLIIVQTIPTYIELWLLFDEVGNPTRSDICYIVCR